MTKISPPFTGPPPPEVPLPRAPLVRVIAQVMFAPILGVLDPATLAPFQDRLRHDYPLLNRESVQHVVLNPGAAPAVQEETIWRLQDVAQSWRVSLAPTFIALETPRYTSRKDFLARLGAVLESLEVTLRPNLAQRVGLRYISRIEGDALARLADLVKPEFVGAVGTPFGDAAQHLLTETLITTEEAMLIARWGKLPANTTVDPQAIEPAATDSWIHDLDLFKPLVIPFAKATLMPLIEALAKRQYAVFRAMVTHAYLRHYGGTP